MIEVKTRKVLEIKKDEFCDRSIWDKFFVSDIVTFEGKVLKNRDGMCYESSNQILKEFR